MTRHVRQPKRADATAQELAALHAELRELRALIEQRLPAVPAAHIWPRMARRHRPGSRDDLARLVQLERDRRPYRLRISASSSLV